MADAAPDAAPMTVADFQAEILSIHTKTVSYFAEIFTATGKLQRMANHLATTPAIVAASPEPFEARPPCPPLPLKKRPVTPEPPQQQPPAKKPRQDAMPSQAPKPTGGADVATKPTATETPAKPTAAEPPAKPTGSTAAEPPAKSDALHRGKSGRFAPKPPATAAKDPPQQHKDPPQPATKTSPGQAANGHQFIPLPPEWNGEDTGDDSSA